MVRYFFERKGQQEGSSIAWNRTSDFYLDYSHPKISSIGILHKVKKEFYTEHYLLELFLTIFAFFADLIWIWIYWLGEFLLLLHWIYQLLSLHLFFIHRKIEKLWPDFYELFWLHRGKALIKSRDQPDQGHQVWEKRWDLQYTVLVFLKVREDCCQELLEYFDKLFYFWVRESKWDIFDLDILIS